MSQVTIFHNPKCSKSRQTLQLLKDNGIEPTIVEYLNHPPTVTELKAIAKKLKVPALDMVRVKEAEFKEAGLSKESSEQELIKAMATYPKLIERPIVVVGNKAAIGRPPENVLEIL